jgi:hypothetical protein
MRWHLQGSRAMGPCRVRVVCLLPRGEMHVVGPDLAPPWVPETPLWVPETPPWVSETPPWVSETPGRSGLRRISVYRDYINIGSYKPHKARAKARGKGLSRY